MTHPTGYTALDLIGFTDKGTYASNVAYVKNDIVHYTGSLWRCKVDDTTNVTPGENANWTAFIGEPQSLVERIIAPLEDNPATVAYATRRQIIYDDYLWEVIDDISVGDPLIDYDVDPTNANIKKAPPVETQLLAAKAEVKNTVSDIVNVLGAKNLLKISATSNTYNGITFTINTDSDGNVESIIADGTATADRYFTISKQDFGDVRFATIETNNSDYIISGLPANEQFYLFYNESSKTTNIAVKQGYTVDNVTIYPMIRPKHISDDTYVPYSKTNQELTGDVGNLPSLTTTDKSSLVNAINEVKAQADKCEVLVISVASFSSLPQTVSNANIESDMVVVNSVLGTPSAQTADWTVTTSNGSLTISGTSAISGSTTATLYLMKSR